MPYYFNTQKPLKSKFQMAKTVLFISVPLVTSEIRLQSCLKETAENYL